MKILADYEREVVDQIYKNLLNDDQIGTFLFIKFDLLYEELLKNLPKDIKPERRIKL